MTELVFCRCSLLSKRIHHDWTLVLDYRCKKCNERIKCNGYEVSRETNKFLSGMFWPSGDNQKEPRNYFSNQQ
jgi:hypothetical protein